MFCLFHWCVLLSTQFLICALPRLHWWTLQPRASEYLSFFCLCSKMAVYLSPGSQLQLCGNMPKLIRFTERQDRSFDHSTNVVSRLRMTCSGQVRAQTAVWYLSSPCYINKTSAFFPGYMFRSVIWAVFPKFALCVLAYLGYETELSQMSYLVWGPILQRQGVCVCVVLWFKLRHPSYVPLSSCELMRSRKLSSISSLTQLLWPVFRQLTSVVFCDPQVTF